KSKWVSDARAHLQAMAAHGLALNVPGVQVLGRPVQFELVARNVRSVHLAVYRIKLEDVLAQKKALRDPERELTAFPFDKFPNVRQRLGAPVAEWDKPMGDKDDYKPTNATLTLPVTQAGAYVVVASAPGV